MLGLFYSLYHQPQLLNLFAMFRAGRHDINTGCINAAMPQNIRQLRNILFNSIECTGKELAKIVREHLAGIDPGFLAQGFHLRPDTASIQRFSVSGEKDHAGADFLFFGILQQQFSQLTGNQNGSALALAVHNDLALLYILHGEELQL